ncbi:hypothetical protein QQP08_023826 [Theobroma cacao]|nr:hypothetical protein QQP08_023826 [Theobroma cacao]
MDGSRRKGYAWAISAGLNAAFAAISAKFFLSPLVRYGLVIIFNVIMWGCYVNSLKALSSLQATVTNFATNFLTSGFAGSFLFEEPLSFRSNNLKMGFCAPYTSLWIFCSQSDVILI